MYEYVYMYVPRNTQNLTSSSCYNTGATERYDMYDTLDNQLFLTP